MTLVITLRENSNHRYVRLFHSTRSLPAPQSRSRSRQNVGNHNRPSSQHTTRVSALHDLLDEEYYDRFRIPGQDRSTVRQKLFVRRKTIAVAREPIKRNMISRLLDVSGTQVYEETGKRTRHTISELNADKYPTRSANVDAPQNSDASAAELLPSPQKSSQPEESIADQEVGKKILSTRDKVLPRLATRLELREKRNKALALIAQFGKHKRTEQKIIGDKELDDWLARDTIRKGYEPLSFLVQTAKREPFVAENCVELDREKRRFYSNSYDALFPSPKTFTTLRDPSPFHKYKPKSAEREGRGISRIEREEACTRSNQEMDHLSEEINRQAQRCSSVVAHSSRGPISPMGLRKSSTSPEVDRLPLGTDASKERESIKHSEVQQIPITDISGYPVYCVLNSEELEKPVSEGRFLCSDENIFQIRPGTSQESMTLRPLLSRNSTRASLDRRPETALGTNRPTLKKKGRYKCGNSSGDWQCRKSQSLHQEHFPMPVEGKERDRTQEARRKTRTNTHGRL